VSIQNMEERQPIYFVHGNQGVLAGRLAGHETPVTDLKRQWFSVDTGLSDIHKVSSTWLA
jgi:hypothetical protein